MWSPFKELSTFQWFPASKKRWLVLKVEERLVINHKGISDAQVTLDVGARTGREDDQEQDIEDIDGALGLRDSHIPKRLLR